MNELLISMTRAEKLILDKIEGLERMIKTLQEKEAQFSIEEISLYKTSKLLHLSKDNVINLVKTGKLKARTYTDSKHRKRYRFKISDIKNFQEQNKYDHVSLHADNVESAEDIAKRIFKV